MRKRLIHSSLIVFLVSLFSVSAVFAQTYSFQVDREVVDLVFNADGSASITYTYDFVNSPSADAIDYVDVGLPNGNYDLSTVGANVDGQTVSDIEPADPQYIQGGSDGITVGLGSYAIQPGEKGTVIIRIGRIEGLLYPGTDSSRPDYASFQFSPNYFGSRYVTGATDISVTFHLPPGVESTESVYYIPSGGWPGADEPTSGFDSDGNIYYTWQNNSAQADTAYIFGGGFPDKYVPADSINTSSPVDVESLVCIGLFGFTIFLIGGSIIASIRSANKRKLAYLPPKISIEGHGIKRGLTAVEAAILMEEPLDKILTMILFGLVKKGPVAVLKREPLSLEITQPLPDDLHPYEVDFINAFETKSEVERRNALQKMVVTLVRTVSEKLKGFSRKETVAYYQNIIAQAWAQVEAANTPEVKGKIYDESLEWTMMDRNFEGRTKEVFSQGPVFIPTWWGRYDPVYRGGFGPVSRPTGTPHTSSIPSNSSSPSLPHLPGSDFAASMVGGLQAFGANVIGELSSFTSDITNVTNPVPKPTYSSSHRGGGSCACACACAGCACACAGGGR